MLVENRIMVKAGGVVELIRMRRHTSPKRLAHPGPSDDQLHTFLCAAAAAPDHGKLMPWRFVLIPKEARDLLAQAFSQALRDMEPSTSPVELKVAREKAYRAPTLLLAIARIGLASERVSRDEIMVSLGCAIQNILLSATDAGFSTSLTSGRTLQSPAIHRLFDLSIEDTPVCFINLGTAPPTIPDRTHNLPEGLFSVLEAHDPSKQLDCAQFETTPGSHAHPEFHNPSLYAQDLRHFGRQEADCRDF